ncbi:S1 RNA-binding domain-containing protein [Patescibacteria group bacterium]|nr:MAG: S1 RNA-binding domain-containing protein [Patescibacteria group bacterium]
MPTIIKEKESEFKKLLNEAKLPAIPKPGDVVSGTILSAGKNEVYISIEGYKTGVVRGRELMHESAELSRLKPGDAVEATVIDLENENGDLELSFRFAGQRRAWDAVLALKNSGQTVAVTVIEANKGGLMARVENLLGFLPVSQLSPEHYPRVAGGEKAKILEKLKSYIGQTMRVKVLDASENDEKLILSEKAVWEEEQKNVLSRYHLDDTVEGEVTAVTDFGAFVKFDSLEGLVHISEIAWQRIDHPRDLLKLGDRVKAKIIGIQGSKIFLSMKQLVDDPWKNVGERYSVGSKVRGKILKANPFGFFVELDPEIHGLAHVSELSTTPIKDPLEVAKIGDTLEWKIISIEPENHRLGLSLKTLTEETKPEEKNEEKSQ